MIRNFISTTTSAAVKMNQAVNHTMRKERAFPRRESLRVLGIGIETTPVKHVVREITYDENRDIAADREKPKHTS